MSQDPKATADVVSFESALALRTARAERTREHGNEPSGLKTQLVFCEAATYHECAIRDEADRLAGKARQPQPSSPEKSQNQGSPGATIHKIH